jgi:hypothetical protein
MEMVWQGNLNRAGTDRTVLPLGACTSFMWLSIIETTPSSVCVESKPRSITYWRHKHTWLVLHTVQYVGGRDRSNFFSERNTLSKSLVRIIQNIISIFFPQSDNIPFRTHGTGATRHEQCQHGAETSPAACCPSINIAHPPLASVTQEHELQIALASLRATNHLAAGTLQRGEREREGELPSAV